MATIGNTNTPTQTFAEYGFNTTSTLAIQVTMPQAGTITSLSAYFAGHGGAATAALCIWDTSGNLLASSANFSVPAGSGGQGGQAFRTQNLQTPYAASNGQVLRIGFWVAAADPWEWTENNGGTEYQSYDASNTGPAAHETFSSLSGTPSIFATYTPIAAAINTGTLGSPVWSVINGAAINTGTLGSPVWTQAPVFINTGTLGSPTWTQVA